MLSYQHGYHAGNFADVIKHTTLCRLLTYITLKEKPLLYLETHSGKGIYDLHDKQAEKTGEYKQGIQILWSERKRMPALFKPYFDALRLLNPKEGLKYYPGSPFLALQTLRKQDRLYFCELHPAEHHALSQMAHLNKKVHVSNTDGLEALNSMLPPPEKRGLIFVDPSYERKEEYKEIPVSIKKAYTKFSTGMYCIWYPLVNKRLTEQLLRGLQQINTHSALKIEFHLTLAPKEGMSGCGLWIINPPYTLASELKQVLDALKTCFNPGISSYVIEAY